MPKKSANFICGIVGLYHIWLINKVCQFYFSLDICDSIYYHYLAFH